MSSQRNPAFDAFLKHLGDELVWAQILIRRLPDGFEVRHVEDRDRDGDGLRPVGYLEARTLAQRTSSGAFRPLKSAPNLPCGWRIHARDVEELQEAIDRLYPGSVADWYAAHQAVPPVTSFREYVERQTGMYRITAKLDDERAAAVVRAGCHPTCCLKQRLWTVTGLDPDPASAKSVIPCLEPCAVLMEFARKAVRLEQERRHLMELSLGELETLFAATKLALECGGSSGREADVGDPLNYRRLRLLFDRIETMMGRLSESEQQ